MTTKIKTATADQSFDLAAEQLVVAFKSWVQHRENQHRWSPKVRELWLKDLGNALDDVWLETYIRRVVGS